MGVMDKMKTGINKFFTVTDDDYYDYEEEETAAEPVAPVREEERQPEPVKPRREKARTNVVSLESGRGPAIRSLGDSQVVVKKVTGVAEVGAVADILKQNRIVVLNLEDCPADAVQRVIDILYGVSYALDGAFNPIAEKAFVITPSNVSVQGEDYSELGDGVEE